MRERPTGSTDSRPTPTPEMVLTAFVGREKQVLRAEDVAVNMLGFDPRTAPNAPKGAAAFTAHVSLSALKRVLATMAEDGTLTYVSKPKRPALPATLQARVDAATEDARRRRRNPHQRLERAQVQATLKEREGFDKAVLAYEEQVQALRGVHFGSNDREGARGYVLTSTLDAEAQHDRLKALLPEASKARAQARAALAERENRDVDRLLRHQGLPSLEEFRCAGLRP